MTQIQLGLNVSGGAARSAGGAFTPASLGFDVFADATSVSASEGATVNSWANAGTLGGTLAQMTRFGDPVNGPRYRANAGTPYLEFGESGGSGYGLYTAVPGSTLGDFTLHMLLRHNHTSAGQAANKPWSTAGAGEYAADGKAIFDLLNQTYDYTNSSDDGAITTSNPLPVTDGQWHLCSWRRQSRVWTMWVDGQVVQTRTGTSDPAAGYLNVGAGGFDEGLSGGIALCLYAASAHSDADVARVWEYYRDRHPLLAADAKVMVVCGDSTSTPGAAWASNADQSWLMPRGTVWQYGSYAQSNNGLGRFYNNSWGGKNTSAHRSAAELARISGWLSRGTSKRILVINTGTNDIRVGGAGLTPAQSYAQITGIIADVRALVPSRVEVVIATICDGNNDGVASYAGFTAKRNTLNGLIVAGADAGDYTVARVDQDSIIGPDWGNPARDDTYFYGDPADPARDGLHRIAPGMDREAIVIRAALASVL